MKKTLQNIVKDFRSSNITVSSLEPLLDKAARSAVRMFNKIKRKLREKP